MKPVLLKIILLFFFFSQCSGQEKKGSYEDLIRRASQARDSIYREYSASDSSNQDSIVTRAGHYVFNLITDEIFNFWYNTPWDFYGQTRIPKQGTIACGYFITAVLSDAGFNIPRVQWAKMASEIFIKKLCTDIKRFHGRPVEEVQSYIAGQEDGLYLAGLDCHVGFIYKRRDLIKFVHSNYYRPSIGVMSEDLDTQNPLRDSQYRVIGKILDDKVILKWITNKRIE